MLKRLWLSLILSVLPLTAMADSDLAKEWGHSASGLRVETAALIQTLDHGQSLEVSDTYALDVFRFGRTSGELARWIDTTDGPKDLGCIFRGMAAEAETQLDVFETATSGINQRAALKRLTTLFADAEMIAAAARKRAPTPGLVAAETPSSCSADPMLALQALQ